MYTFLLVILVLVAFFLVVSVLLQAGKGGGLAANFGGSGTDMFIGTRQAGNILTKASWWLGGLFLALSFILSIASTRRTAARSIIEQGLTPPPGASAPAAGQGSAPAIPLEPATQPTTPPATTPPAGQSKTPPTP